MNQKIAVVAENPLALIVAFNAVGDFAALFQVEMYGVGDGLVLPGVGSAADDKVVSEGGNGGQVEHQNILRLLFACGADGENPAWFVCFVGIQLQLAVGIGAVQIGESIGVILRQKCAPYVLSYYKDRCISV